MQDLMNELTEHRKMLDKAIVELKNRGKAKAKTEEAYRVALSKEMLLQRAEGTPVTILGDIVRGKEDIANLKCARDIAETLYESNMQAIYSIKLNIGIVENQINAERKGM